jgi:hypothetical protein
MLVPELRDHGKNGCTAQHSGRKKYHGEMRGTPMISRACFEIKV